MIKHHLGHFAGVLMVLDMSQMSLGPVFVVSVILEVVVSVADVMPGMS